MLMLVPNAPPNSIAQFEAPDRQMRTATAADAAQGKID
jgi:hypothetical protein